MDRTVRLRPKCCKDTFIGTGALQMNELLLESDSKMERELLGLVTKGAPLSTVLSAACLILEKRVPQGVCSIMLVDPQGTSLVPGAAPSLPVEYCEALVGLPIGPEVGSCGTAVATRKIVICAEIATDPKWAAFRDLAAKHGLRACWSIPLFDVNHNAIGAFAVYHHAPHYPLQSELQAALELSDTVAIAIAWQIDRDALFRAQQAADRANEAKSAFLAQMSHELRTPLNAILGFSDAMRMEALGPLGAPKYKQYVQHIHGSGELLLEMVNGLLDLARVEAGQAEVRHEQFGFATLLDECIAYFRTPGQMIPNINACSVCADVRVTGDRPALLRVMLNLLSNAIRHTSPAGNIFINCSLTGSGFTVVVRDSGTGIPREHMDRIGQPFVRVNNAPGAATIGSGLGLFISRSILERHGGSLHLESEEGQGTSAIIHLPLSRVERARH